MGVNWVSLAPDSVGWLFWTLGLPGRADGDSKSSRIGRVSDCTSWGWGVPGQEQGSSKPTGPEAPGPSRELVGLARQTICGLRWRAGRSARGGVSVWTDLTCQTSPEPPLTHPLDHFDDWATR